MEAELLTSSQVTVDMVSSLCGGRCGSFLITPKPDLFPGPKMMASTPHLGWQNLSGSWKLPALLGSEHCLFLVSWPSYQHHFGPKSARLCLMVPPSLAVPSLHGIHFMHLSSGIDGKLDTHRSRAQASQADCHGGRIYNSNVVDLQYLFILYQFICKSCDCF